MILEPTAAQTAFQNTFATFAAARIAPAAPALDAHGR
jgi:hypothetical protein